MSEKQQNIKIDISIRNIDKNILFPTISGHTVVYQNAIAINYRFDSVWQFNSNIYIYMAFHVGIENAA